MADVDERLNKLIKTWNSKGLPHPKDCFNVDILHLTSRFDALVHLLLDTATIDGTEYDIAVKEKLIEYVENMMPNVEKLKRQQDIQQGAVQVLFGPNGEILH